MPRLNASSRIMYETAQELGIECVVFDDKETILMSKGSAQWYTRGSRTSLQSSVGKSIADNKSLTKKVLAHFQIPTARFCVLKTTTDLDQLDSLQFPIVMKPTNERHGKGVLVGIQSKAQAAEIWANQTYDAILCEEMLKGTEYRIVCVDYKFVAAAFRKPAHVTGDGVHTVTDLIAEKNRHPWRGDGHENNLSLIKVDDAVEKYLSEQGFNLESIPAPEQVVNLRKTANLSTGGEAWDVTDTVSVENQQLFEKIARACDLNTVGIDIMCDSLTTPIITQDHAGVIEVNASPGLRMHHYPIQGEPRLVAHKILTMVMDHFLT
ncbi:MAG TPA: hypothetical protein VD999_07455 [Vitreimonas sp.]|nr:hypothetical protein [Vitreimonas sp.]